MLPNAVRAGKLCVVAGCLLLCSGCWGLGICGGACRVYSHPDPACYGLRYEGCCTYQDDLRDGVNQVTDILLP